MKKILFAVLLAVQSLVGAAAVAAPCTTSSLAAYVGLGSGGCTIGSFRFSDFALLTSPTGSIPFTSIGVLPVSGTPGVIGLDFRVGASAGPGVFFDNLISYRVTGLGASINGASLFITGSSSSGDGAVTAVENLCIAGLFTGADGVSGCSGTARDLIVVDAGGSADPPVSLAFLSAAALAVVTDIGVDGGTDGTGALAFASNRFLVAPAVGVVPEPSSVLLMAAGLFALLGYRSARPVRAARLR